MTILCEYLVMKENRQVVKVIQTGDMKYWEYRNNGVDLKSMSVDDFQKYSQWYEEFVK